MAMHDACTSSTETFKVPPEPSPLPSLDTDEESFVVLWNDKDNYPLEDSCDTLEPIGSTVIEEGQQLINKELLQMEQQPQIISENGVPNLETSTNSNTEQKDPGQPQASATSMLEQSTMSALLPKMPQMENGFESSEIISIANFPSDFASVEVQQKVSQIIDENMRLKDTILQNNMSMRSQYERIVSWQEDVHKVHQAHKDKLIEAKEVIEKLKKENDNLNLEFRALRETNDEQQKELTSLKKSVSDIERQSSEKLVESSEKNMNASELDIANKKIRDLELVVQNLTMENSILKSDQENLTKSIENIYEYEKQIESLQGALNKSKLDMEEVKLELVNHRQLNEARDTSLNEVIENLRAQLFYRTQEQSQLPSPEEVANIRQQLAQTQVLLTQVELSKSTACAQVETLTNEITQLQSSTQDEIFAIQTQMNLYKTDFEAERDAKETVKFEHTKLSEDMMQLQRRNQQLQEEIELLRQRGDYVVLPPHRQQQEHPSEASAPSASNDHSQKCPKCFFGFNTYQALENHVYRCIDLDDNLP